MAAYPSVTAICQQIHPPTGITHCACATFARCLPPKEHSSQLPNLIVVRATQLEVHYVSPELKLELVDQYPLYGEVESMAVLKSRAKSGQRDALVLAFRDAKVSVIEWDDATDGIRTSSLHCFENDPALRGGHEVFPYGPRVAADPQGRCICCMLYMCQMAVLPAMDPDHLNDEEHLSRGALVGNSYILNLGKLGIKEVRDFVFLHGYNEPVILILHEPNPTWAARLSTLLDREKKDSCCLTAISLNFQEKIYPVIWSSKGLPSDAHKLIAVPSRGALVLSLNLIAYYIQGQHLAIGVNSTAFAGEVPQRVELDPAVEVPSVTATKLAINYANNVHPECAPAISKGASLATVSGIELKASQHAWLDSDSLILALRSGQLVSVHLKTDGSKVISIQLSKCGSAPIVSCATVISENILFLGSWLGDSLLAKFTRHQRIDKNEEAEQPDVQGVDDVNAESLDSEALDDDQLFGLDLAKGSVSDVDYRLHVTDVLQCVGPIRDMVAGAPPEAEGQTQHTSLSPQIVACVGAGRGGALAVLRRGVVAEVLIEVPVPDVEGVWALHYCDEDEVAPMMLGGAPVHSYLVIASSSDTMVLESGDELEEVTKRSDFVTTETTIFAGSMFGHTRILQVCPNGVWLFRGTELCQELSAESISKEVYHEKQRPPNMTCPLSQEQQESKGDQPSSSAFDLSSSPEKPEEADVASSDRNESKDGICPVEVNEDKTTLDMSNLETMETGQAQDGINAAPSSKVNVADEFVGNASSVQQQNAGKTTEKELMDVQFENDGVGSSHNATSRGNYFGDFEDDPMDFDPAPERLGIVGQEQTASIKSASVSDPLLLILLDNGEAVLFEGDSDSRVLYPMETANYALRQLPRENYLAGIMSCALYSDNTLWLSEGATSALFPAPLFCVLCRKGGSMELYDLPQMECIFSVCGFSLGWHILGNDSQGEGLKRTVIESELEEPIPAVNEIRMESFTPPYSQNSDDVRTGACVSGRPIIFSVLDDGSLLVYRAFRTRTQSLAFKRVSLETMGDGGVGTLGPGGTIPAVRDRMVRFDNIGEDSPCSGIFVAGVTPLLLIACQSGIMIHRLLVDGAVTSMTSFSNVNCPQGFILAMTSRQLKICSLHKERLDCPWPCHKVALRCTPNKIAWYPDSRFYLVLCSRPIAFRERIEEEEGGDTHSAAAYAVSNQAAKLKGYEEGHEVRLMIPGSWTTPWLFPLDSNELGLSVRSVHLKDQSDGAVHPMVAVGTAFTIGEDYPSTGRCLLFRIRKEDPDSKEGIAIASEESWSGVVACSHEVRGPVSALAVLDGCLLMAAGNRLELCAWNGSSLTRMAFFDGPLYITSVNVVKSFVLFGDLHKGIHFVWYTYPVSGHETTPDAREILLLGKDFNHSDVHATEFLVNGTMLSFLFADGGNNVRIHSYHRDHPDSWNGRKLLPESSFHVGHSVGRMVRMRLCCPDGVNRQAAVYGTMDGGLGYVAPMWDQNIFDRLMLLQKLLVRNIVHSAGLNPVAFRMRHRQTPKAMGGGSQHGKPSPQDRVLDGDLLVNYWFLDRVKQLSLAHAVGTTRHQLIEDLQGIALATSFF